MAADHDGDGETLGLTDDDGAGDLDGAADPDGDTEPDGDGELDGAAELDWEGEIDSDGEGASVGDAIGRRVPPAPSSTPLRAITPKTASVAMTKRLDARSLIRMAGSGIDGAMVGCVAPRRPPTLVGNSGDVAPPAPAVAAPAPAARMMGAASSSTAIAAAYLAWAMTHHRSGFVSGGPGLRTLLVLAGPVTAVPLLCFAGAARRLPLSTMGFLQYVSPTLQFLLAVAVLNLIARLVSGDPSGASSFRSVMLLR